MIIHSISSRPPLSSSFNQSPCLLHDTYAQNPIPFSSPKCSCSCYCCYHAANISMHDRFGIVNPSLLPKGLSQSILIQWSVCKRLIFHGRIRQSFGNTFGSSAFYDIDESYYYKKLHAFRKKEQFLSNGIDDCVNDIEVMLGLLTNEEGLEYNDVKSRKKSTKEKKNVGFKCDEVVKMKSLKKSENLDLKKEVCLGGLESNRDFEVKSENYDVGQTSSSECKNDLKRDCNGSVEEVVGTVEKQRQSVQEPDVLLGKDTVNGYYGETVGVTQDLRNKSEKKLNKEFSQHDSNASVNIEAGEQLRHRDESGSRMKYKRFTEVSDKGKTVIEPTFTAEHKLKVIPEVRKLQDFHERGTFSLPKSRIKSFEEKPKEISAQIVDSSEIKHQKEELNTQQMGKQKQYPETSNSEAVVAEPTSVEDKDNDVSRTCGQKDGGSRHSSQGFGPKGPSDEMWHVTDASTSGSSENAAEPVKTRGRSLWSIIGDVVWLHWKSPRSGSRTPTSVGAKGSSYLSTSSDTWFSSHEPDDSNDENVRQRIIKGLDSPLPKRPSRNTYLPMIKESSFSSKRSPEIKKMLKPGSNHLNVSKSRELVHKDQVFTDNFDRWEETYNLEKKQRKEDEMFMREAILEAKKAADVLEVPVGAVLVKDGEIIARGHNMVEELHDSTAHAEMICIRKASTAVRSWRLTDTTLYVTLEPCPMCAGAILQARIGAVVWGAPNKLLGADGSWIRLFCDGDGGSSSMQTETDLPPAPAHPFHPNMAVRRGVLAAECAEIMQHFFQQRRKKKAEPQPPNLPSSVNVPHHHQSSFLSKIHHALKIIFCL